MFDSYRDKYENVRMKREDGILEVALHTRGGPLVFNGYVHEALVRAFRDIGDDRDNHVVILTGTGDEFCAQLSPEGFGSGQNTPPSNLPSPSAKSSPIKHTAACPATSVL